MIIIQPIQLRHIRLAITTPNHAWVEQFALGLGKTGVVQFQS